MYIYIYIYIYGIYHRGIYRSSYRKLAWVGFESTTTEFRSDALTYWATCYEFSSHSQPTLYSYSNFISLFNVCASFWHMYIIRKSSPFNVKIQTATILFWLFLNLQQVKQNFWLNGRRFRKEWHINDLKFSQKISWKDLTFCFCFNCFYEYNKIYIYIYILYIYIYIIYIYKYIYILFVVSQFSLLKANHQSKLRNVLWFLK